MNLMFVLPSCCRIKTWSCDTGSHGKPKKAWKREETCFHTVDFPDFPLSVLAKGFLSSMCLNYSTQAFLHCFSLSFIPTEVWSWTKTYDTCNNDGTWSAFLLLFIEAVGKNTKQNNIFQNLWLVHLVPVHRAWWVLDVIALVMNM